MNTTTKSNYITEGIAIAGFTLFSYIIAYKYESGFCDYWGIPDYLVEISLSTVVGAGLSVFSFFLGIFMLVNIPTSFFEKHIPEEDSYGKRIAYFIIVSMILSIALFQGYGFSFVSIFITCLILLLIILLAIVPWYFDKKEYPEKTDFFSRISRQHEKRNTSLITYPWLERIVGNKVYFLLMCFLPIMTLFASMAGSYSAKNVQSYLLVESEGLILIKRYGESYILRTIDLTKNKVSGEILIWKSEDIAKYKLTQRHLKNIEIIKK